nr:hypothetical protein [Oscillospiraceae bacterium]
MKKLNVIKRTLAGILAILTVAATTLPANVGIRSFVTGDTEIVAEAVSNVKECSMYASLSVSNVSGTGGAQSGEDCSGLFDNSDQTKWCVNWITGTTDGNYITNAKKDGNAIYFTFTAGTTAVTPTAYSITTGQDTDTWQNRSPVSWHIDGSNDGSTWTTLTTVHRDNQLSQNSNNHTVEYPINNSGAYKYFRFTIDEILANASDDAVQFVDFKMKIKHVDQEHDASGTKTWDWNSPSSTKVGFTCGNCKESVSLGPDSITPAADGKTATATVKINNVTYTNTVDLYDLHLPDSSVTAKQSSDTVTNKIVKNKQIVVTSSIPVVFYNSSGTELSSSVSGNNYTLSASNVTGEIFVKYKGSPTIVVDDGSYVYDGTAKEPTIKVYADPAKAKLIPTSEYTVSYSNNINAGSGTVTVKDVSGGSYTITTTSVNFTISKKPVEIAWGNTSFTYDKTEHCPTATVTGFIAADGSPYSITGGKINASATAYTATATLTNNNYCFKGTNNSSTTTSFTIAPKVVGLDWTNTNLTYSGSTQHPDATATGTISGDVCVVNISGGQTNVGSYTATAASLSNPNYKLPANTTTSYKINPKVIGINWSNTAFTYDTKAHKPTATATGLCGSDSCVITVSGEQTNAGTYTATATAVSNNNYTLPDAAFTSTEFKINPFVVGLSWSNLQFTYDKTSHLPTATATNVYSGDTCNVTVSGAATNAGLHTATAASLSNANYALPDDVTEDYYIAPKTVELAWGTTTFTYNGLAQVPAAYVTNLCQGDNCLVLVDGAKTDFGTYTATAAGLTNANYTLPQEQYCTKSFSIQKRQVGVTWGISNFNYDGEFKCPEATLSNLVGTDDCTPVVSGAQIDAGNYTASVALTGSMAKNYELNGDTTKAFSVYAKLDLDEALTHITSVEYGGGELDLTSPVHYIKVGEPVKITTTGKLAFEELTDDVLTQSKNKSNWFYNFTIPTATNVVQPGHVYDYRVRTNPDDNTELLGQDRNDVTAVEGVVAKLTVADVPYLADLDIDVLPQNNAFLTIDNTNVVYRYSPITNGVALVNEMPFYVGEYKVVAGVGVNGASYDLRDNFEIVPRAYAENTAEITAALAQSKYNYSGNDITPVVIVTDSNDKLNEDTLVEGVDYDLSGDLTKQDAGNYTIHVTFKGNYSGETDLAWSITAQKLQTIE